MRILLISDAHSNQVALETVLRTVDRDEPVERSWCLGDTIGYGPRPNECIDLVRDRCEYVLSGNHDLACIGDGERGVDLQDFNPDARVANEWNGAQLTEANLTWLKQLDALIVQLPNYPEYTMAHGSPRQPVWEYLLTLRQAHANFEHANFRTTICFVGHSHIPLLFRDDFMHEMEIISPDDNDVIRLDPGVRYIINPGSVGQPRNRDPRAAYAILDTDAQTVTFRRIEYDIRATQAQMREADLPGPLIRRLQFGL